MSDILRNCLGEDACDRMQKKTTTTTNGEREKYSCNDKSMKQAK